MKLEKLQRLRSWFFLEASRSKRMTVENPKDVDYYQKALPLLKRPADWSLIEAFPFGRLLNKNNA